MKQEKKVLKGQREILNEIDATVVEEEACTFGHLENEIGLKKIIQEKLTIQEARPNGNNAARHQRLKRKRLLELQEEEFAAKKSQIKLLIHENFQLKEIVKRKKIELIGKIQMKD
eukprot:GFUD01012952.1.p1 GENE.GFUD01012952.1~~GFUD01012952.1.p1  ORF type:complete len:115 (-),score=34.95 GFUD01012952.1:125-469(-)